MPAAAWRASPSRRRKAAAKEFVAALAPDDRVAVMRFADSVTLVQDYTVDRARDQRGHRRAVGEGQHGAVRGDGARPRTRRGTSAFEPPRDHLSQRRRAGRRRADVTREQALAAARRGRAVLHDRRRQRGRPGYLQQLADVVQRAATWRRRTGDLTACTPAIGELLAASTS